MTTREKRAVEALRRAADMIEGKDVDPVTVRGKRREAQAAEFAHVAYAISNAAQILISTGGAYVELGALPQQQRAITALVHAEDMCARLRDRKGFRADMHHRTGARRVASHYHEEP